MALDFFGFSFSVFGFGFAPLSERPLGCVWEGGGSVSHHWPGGVWKHGGRGHTPQPSDWSVVRGDTLVVLRR